MRIVFVLVMIVAGLILIVKGGDLFVDASMWMARIAHVSEMIIGATIVSVGTTLPELFSSVTATIRGLSGDGDYTIIALANALGSMLANAGLVLSLTMMIRPPRYDEADFCHSGIYVLAISVIMAIFLRTGYRISIPESVVLLVFFGIYMIDTISRARARAVITTREELELYTKAKAESKAKMIASFIIGGASILGGAVLLVGNARSLALTLGVSAELIGVTIVAVGTSLPELVTSLTSIRRGTGDIGVGNIMGAHIINATLIVGLVAIIGGGIAVDAVTANVTSWVLVIVVAVMILPTIIRRRMSRWQGAVMASIYTSYIVYNILINFSTQ